MEPAVCRSRADYRGGDGRRRAARQFLRGDRGASRYGPQSPIHITFDGGHGTAHRLRRNRDPLEEGRGLADLAHPTE